MRGLKPAETAEEVACVESHPMWVRGLKLSYRYLSISVAEVAPHVGAWIETTKRT